MAESTLKTPRGTKDFLPKDARHKRWIEETLLELFACWNYQEIVTPTMEYQSVVTAEGALGPGDNLYRFFEKEGELIALRPDATTPVARLVAARLKEEPKPIRLCYSANVFRYAEPHAGRRREFYQAGVELVGSSSYRADAETIALAVQALKAVGLKDFRIDIGHVDFYNGILEHGRLSNSERRRIRTALLKKDYVALGEFMADSNLAEADKKLLEMLPHLRGGKDILAEALKAVTNPISQKAIHDLQAIYELLGAFDVVQWVQIDLGMVKDIEYYTGMVLEAYTADMGFTIGTGGRYDNLISQFGYDCPATGFALGVERLMLAISRQNAWPETSDKKVLCTYYQDAARQGWLLSKTLRKHGFIVELDVVAREPCMDPAQMVDYARTMGHQWIVVPLASDAIKVWHGKMGWQTVDLQKLITILERGEWLG